jgi:DNA-binding CsgD family transcriptional regulator
LHRRVVRLTHGDYEAVLGTIRSVGGAGDSAEFSQIVVESVARLVPSEVVTLNEVDPVAGRVIYAVEPSSFPMPEDAPAILAGHADSHPLIRHVAETGDGSTRRISDFLTQDEFHATALYELLYRSMGVEYQVALTLSAPLPTVVAIAASRTRHDFSDREQAVLETLRPHLAQAWQNAHEQERLRGLLSAAGDALSHRNSGVIVLWDPPQELIPGTLTSLYRYFGRPPLTGWLPARVERWLTSQRSRLRTDGLPHLTQPLTARLGSRRLVLRYLPAQGAHPGAIVLDEGELTIPVPRLEALRLSKREAEVVQLAVEGSTNTEIGARLRIAPGTVKKHLDNVYAKLGVRGRLQLAALVHDLLRT